MAMEIQYTNIDIRSREKEVFFTINNKSKFKVPSKLFPISSKKYISLFTPKGTIPFYHEDFIKAIDKIDLPIGNCYSNSEKIRQIAESFGLNAYYFSGWVFKNGDMPKHHAWVVIVQEEGISIIDSLKENLFREAYKQYPTIDYKDPDWRKKTALAIKQVQKEMPLNSQQIIIGQVLDGFFYVGSPDTLENSRKIFNKLIEQFPQHPAYMGEGDSLEGRSKLQEEMKRIGIK